MKKQYLITLFIMIFGFNSMFSQEYDPYTYQDIKKKSPLLDKMFFGGGLGLQFGNYTSVNFAAEVGYKVTPSFETGVGGYYIYVSDNLNNNSDYVFGGKIFSRLFVTSKLFIQGEFEMLNIADYNTSTYRYTGERIFIPGLLGGIGYRQKLGEKAALMASVLYNFLIQEKTPYSNPIIRFAIVF